MISERRCHYYVFGSLFRSCHGLEAIWLLHWKFFGLALLMFLKKQNDFQPWNSPFFSCKCAWVFFTICKIKPFLFVMYLGLLLQSYHGLEAIYYIESFLGTYICWCFLVSMIESCNSPFLSCNFVRGLWHKQKSCHINEKLCHRDDEWEKKMPLLCKRENIAWRSFQC
jgi:hypothetical protein